MADISLNIAVADDDEPICNLLKNYLHSFEGVQVVGVATDGESLMEIVQKHSPDAVFMDIEMPGLDGLSVVQHLRQKYPNLFVVFVTAHSQYAVEAFNLDATDFLAKPLSRERLSKSIAKISRFKTLLESHYNPAKTGGEQNNNGDQQLILKSGHGIILIKKRDILFIEKTRKTSTVHTSHGRYEVQYSLAELEKSLADSNYYRCHKSFIINIRQVEKIIPYADRAYEISFYNYPGKATMRREKFEELCSLMMKKL